MIPILLTKENEIRAWFSNIRGNLDYTLVPSDKYGFVVNCNKGIVITFPSSTASSISIPKFNIVEGNFSCSDNELTEINFAPCKVVGNVSIINTKITSLVGSGFEEVSGNFHCFSNELTSLEGGPKKVGKRYNCSHNKLTSLEGSPAVINQEFNCSDNPLLTTLEGGPQLVTGYYMCRQTGITTLQGLPQDLSGSYSLFAQNCNLVSLKGSPPVINGDFEVSINNLSSLEGAPQSVRGSFVASANKLRNLKFSPQYINASADFSFNELDNIDDLTPNLKVGVNLRGNPNLGIHSAVIYDTSSLYATLKINAEKKALEQTLSTQPPHSSENFKI